MTIHIVIQALAAALGSFGFAILFNIRGKRLVWIFFAALFDWAVYLAARGLAGFSPVVSLFWAAMFTGLLCEGLARVMRSPVILFMVPALIPLVPGKDLYDMMECFVLGQYAVFSDMGTLVVLETGAIAFGVIASSSIVKIIGKLRETASVR